MKTPFHGLAWVYAITIVYVLNCPALRGEDPSAENTGAATSSVADTITQAAIDNVNASTDGQQVGITLPDDSLSAETTTVPDSTTSFATQGPPLPAAVVPAILSGFQASMTEENLSGAPAPNEAPALNEAPAPNPSPSLDPPPPVPFQPPSRSCSTTASPVCREGAAPPNGAKAGSCMSAMRGGYSVSTHFNRMQRFMAAANDIWQSVAHCVEEANHHTMGEATVHVIENISHAAEVGEWLYHTWHAGVTCATAATVASTSFLGSVAATAVSVVMKYEKSSACSSCSSIGCTQARRLCSDACMAGFYAGQTFDVCARSLRDASTNPQPLEGADDRACVGCSPNAYYASMAARQTWANECDKRCFDNDRVCSSWTSGSPQCPIFYGHEHAHIEEIHTGPPSFCGGG